MRVAIFVVSSRGRYKLSFAEHVAHSGPVLAWRLMPTLPGELELPEKGGAPDGVRLRFFRMDSVDNSFNN